MALPVVIAENQTASPIFLSGLGVTVPGSGQLTLSNFNFAYEIFSDAGLEAELQAGNLTLNIDGITLSTDQISALMGIISAGTLISSMSVYDSAGFQTWTTTPVTLNLDTIAYNSNPGQYTLAADALTIVTEGIYLILANVTLDSGGGNRTQADSWMEANGVEIPGTRMTHYLRQLAHGDTGAVSFVRQASAGTALRLRSVRLVGSGTCRTVANGTRLTVIRIK